MCSSDLRLVHAQAHAFMFKVIDAPVRGCRTGACTAGGEKRAPAGLQVLPCRREGLGTFNVGSHVWAKLFRHRFEAPKKCIHRPREKSVVQSAGQNSGKV